MSKAPDLLSISDLCEKLGICRATLWSLEKKGSLPEPIMLGTRTKRWRAVDIDGFLAAGGTKTKAAG